MKKNKLNNNGFTVYELLIGFVFLVIIGYFLMSTVFSLKDKNQGSMTKTKLLDLKIALTKDIEADITKYQLIDAIVCGNTCVNLYFTNNLSKRLNISTTTNTVTYGDNEYLLVPGSYIEMPIVSTNSVSGVVGQKNGIINIKVPIMHDDIKGDYGINVTSQYYSYITNGAIVYLDSYDPPVNISGNYHWKDRTSEGNDARMYNFNNATNSTYSGYEASKKTYHIYGDNDYMVTTKDMSYDLTNGYTIEYVFTPKTYASGAGTWKRYMQFLGNPGSTSAGLIKWYTLNNSLYFDYFSQQSIIVDSNMSKYHSNIHVVQVVVNSSQLLVYIDNSLRYSSSISQSLSGSFEQKRLYMSISQYLTYEDVITQDVYSVRIYNRQLSSSELKHNYNVDVLKFLTD